MLLKGCVVEMYWVPSGSMSPTLLPGDYVMVSKVAYALGLPERLPLPMLHLPWELRWWYRGIQRWDIVVFEFPQSRELHYYLKRVVGLPGDTLRFSGDTLWIGTQGYLLPGLRESRHRVVVPYRGMVLELTPSVVEHFASVFAEEGVQVECRGDQVLLNSVPARTYTVRQDYYFVMGDNYELSFDSRHWGTVAQRRILGKALCIVYSRDTATGSVRWTRIGRFLH
jgi:signal peptidase I